MCSLLGSSWGCSGCILLLGFTDTGRSTDQVFKMTTTHGRASSAGPARFSSASATRSWRRIDLRRRQRLARGRRRSQLVADRAQHPDTRQQREPVAIDDVVDLAEQAPRSLRRTNPAACPERGVVNAFRRVHGRRVRQYWNWTEPIGNRYVLFVFSAILANFWIASLG